MRPEPDELVAVVRDGDLEQACVLLSKGANPNEEDSKCRLPLLEAARLGSLPMLRLLLANGAEPNRANSDQKTTALIRACMYGHLDAAKVLVAYGAKATLKSGGLDALSAARDARHADVVDYLRSLPRPKKKAGPLRSGIATLSGSRLIVLADAPPSQVVASVLASDVVPGLKDVGGIVDAERNAFVLFGVMGTDWTVLHRVGQPGLSEDLGTKYAQMVSKTLSTRGAFFVDSNTSVATTLILYESGRRRTTLSTSLSADLLSGDAADDETFMPEQSSEKFVEIVKRLKMYIPALAVGASLGRGMAVSDAISELAGLNPEQIFDAHLLAF